MIKTVIKCHDNMVLVFDEKGERIPRYHGQYEDVKESILKDAPPNALFGCLSDSEPELRRTPRGEW